jgi:hypothetical protein
MSMPSMPSPTNNAVAPSTDDPATTAAMQEAEATRKKQVMNMQGRSSTIATSALGDQSAVEGYKVSLLGGQ